MSQSIELMGTVAPEQAGKRLDQVLAELFPIIHVHELKNGF